MVFAIGGRVRTQSAPWKIEQISAGKRWRDLSVTNILYVGIECKDHGGVELSTVAVACGQLYGIVSSSGRQWAAAIIPE